MLGWGYNVKCCQLTTGKCLVALWSNLTLTCKCSGVNLITPEIHQLNKCFKVPGKEGELANKMEDALFGPCSLDYARFP